jgi:hypothetical protein
VLQKSNEAANLEGVITPTAAAGALWILTSATRLFYKLTLNLFH